MFDRRALLPMVTFLMGCQAASVRSNSGTAGNGNDGGGNPGAVDAGGAGHSGAGGASAPPGGGTPCTSCTDFPKDPVIEPGVTAGAPAQFGPAGAGSPTNGPCLLEPQSGALYPRNWLRPRVRFVPSVGHDLFEIRITAPGQVNDLVVYTRNTSWTMPKALWSAVAARPLSGPLLVTVRSLATTMPAAPVAVSAASSLTVAPANALGSIVYWTTSGGSALKGFRAGDETVVEVLRPAAAATGCVGCHSSTPDGEFVGFAASDDPATGIPSRIDLRSANGQGLQPSYLSAAARTLLSRRPQQVPSFSGGHWKTGDRIALTMLLLAGRHQVVWTDLEATSTAEGTGWGILNRQGDSGEVSLPVFSHAGDRVFYSQTPMVMSSIDQIDGDIWQVPWNGHQGGAATPVDGASDPTWNEFFPSLSSDDRLLAYTRLPKGGFTRENPQDEIFVVPAGGGTPTRMTANDPPACLGRSSPGVMNSWPKWAADRTVVDDKTYYWIVFSSTRATALTPQLFLAGVVVSGQTITTYPAVYLWNQPETEANHTPAWDNFKIIVP